jgi:hypothetical protein
MPGFFVSETYRMPGEELIRCKPFFKDENYLLDLKGFLKKNQKRVF